MPSLLMVCMHVCMYTLTSDALAVSTVSIISFLNFSSANLQSTPPPPAPTPPSL